MGYKRLRGAGDVVAVVGADGWTVGGQTCRLFITGIVGLISMTSTEAGQKFGATSREQWYERSLEQIMKLTGGLGADVAIEAVGSNDLRTRDTHSTLWSIANIGVHGAPVSCISRSCGEKT